MVDLWQECLLKKKEQNDDKKKDGASVNATVEGSDWAFTAIFAGRTFAVRESCKGQEINVYDSAASTHMSPDHH